MLANTGSNNDLILLIASLAVKLLDDFLGLRYFTWFALLIRERVSFFP